MATDDQCSVVTLRGDGSVDPLLRRAVAEIEALDLDVVAVIDHSGDADEVGVTVPETKGVRFGSPEVAARLIRAHPLTALDLPLELLIRDGPDGQVLVSYRAPTHLTRVHGLTHDEADAFFLVETIARAIGSRS